MSPDRWSRPRGFDRYERPRRPPPGGRTAPAGARRGSRGFSTTWWGGAWIDALENRARLDPNRLPRGRTYARQGHVRSIDTAAGLVTAAVSGSRPTPYLVSIRVRTYSDAEWEAVFDAIASRAVHAAALLDGDLEPEVVDDARRAGVDLLPEAGDLQPRCSCPDWADLCKHAAAVCYLMAAELDEDPFRLFALRGRSRDEVLSAIRARRSAAADPSGGAEGSGPGSDPGAGASTWETDPGVVARDAWARADERGPRPGLPLAPARPGPPAPWPVDPPARAPFDAVGLRALAADAAQRAWLLIRGEGDSALGLPLDEDRARRAAADLDGEGWADLVARSGESAADLARRARAWQCGGAAGLAASEEDPWTPDPQVAAAARDALVGFGAPARSVRVAHNRVTVAPWRAQLRLARDGRWWGFAKRGNRWELITAGFEEVDDAADALTSAVGTR